MVSSAQAFTSFRFSTRGIPPARRLAAWNDAASGNRLLRRILSPPLASERAFDVEMEGHAFDSEAGAGLCLMRMTVAAGGTARRNADLLADGNDDIVLQVHQQGGRVVSQFGREAIIGAGVGLVTSNADPSMITLPGPARFISIAVPRRLMRASAPRVEDLFLRPVPFANGMLRVLARYVDFADDDPSEWTAELRHSVATHIHDLCALIIGAGRDATVVAERRGLRAARMKAVKADIAENLGDIDLRATSIALRQGITPRYVHKLFEDEGVTLSEFVRGQRMALVHRMLSDPRHVHRTIGSIAIEAGFGDLSTFNRDFRRQFAATPSEVRGSRKA